MFYGILAAVVVVLLLAFGVYHFGVFQKRSPFIDRKIAGPTKVSEKWVEITPDEPLKPKGDYQEVGLYLAEPYFHDLMDRPSAGVRMPDGSRVVPDVQIVDTAGNVFTLKISGTRGKETIEYRLSSEEAGKEYRTVRIRAEREIKLDAVYGPPGFSTSRLTPLAGLLKVLCER